MNKRDYIQDTRFRKEGSKDSRKESPKNGAEENRLEKCSVMELLTELGSRFNIRYGELKAKFHNHQPSTKVVIDHKVEKEII